MSDPEAVGTEQKPKEPEGDDPWGRVQTGVAMAVGLVLTIAWVALLVWMVARLI
jgi:flagellar biogenesis protein FliO